MSNQTRRKFLIGASLGLLALCFGALGLTETKKPVIKKTTKKVTKKPLAKKIAAAPAKPLAKTALSKPLSSAPNPRLGINLGGIDDVSTELPFVDMFRLNRGFEMHFATGGPAPEPLDLDEHGWVKNLPKGRYAPTVITTVEGGHFPNGHYTVLYDGEGELGFFNAGGDGDIVSKAKGRIVINVDSSRGLWILTIKATNPANYIRNIRVIMPGFENTYQTDPWHPVFMKRWAGVACLRYMDFMHTNNSKQVRWADRPKVTDASYAPKGAPLEVTVDLANRQQAEPWFCMPHLADDDYVRQYATYVKANLDPTLKVWVEYSNEVWNSIFEQSIYAGKAGQRLKLAKEEWEAANHYAAIRSVQIFKIWEQVFGGTARLVRVLASQAATAEVSSRMLSTKVSATQIAADYTDALAIAPYISMLVAPTPSADALAEGQVQNWSTDQVFEYLNRKGLPEATGWIKQSKKVADKFNVPMVAYEGGQHMLGVLGAENNEKLTKLLFAASADPRMGKLYSQYLSVWEQQGGDLFCAFSSVAGWSKWGTWGAMQYYDEPPSKAHKFTALLDWAKKRGQKMSY